MMLDAAHAEIPIRQPQVIQSRFLQNSIPSARRLGIFPRRSLYDCFLHPACQSSHVHYHIRPTGSTGSQKFSASLSRMPTLLVPSVASQHHRYYESEISRGSEELRRDAETYGEETSLELSKAKESAGDCMSLRSIDEDMDL